MPKLKSAIVLTLICVVTINCTSGNKSITKKVDSLAAIKLDTSEKTTNITQDSTIAASDLSEKDWMLIPGIAAGKTRLNESSMQALKILGKADGGDAAMGKSVMIWYNNHDSTANSIAVYTARDTGNAPIARIKQIRVTSPSFQTANGIHPGSTLEQIKSKYKVVQTETYQDEGSEYRVYSSNNGIAFEMDASEICVAVVIFDAGKMLPGTYLKFRTTNKFFKRT